VKASNQVTRSSGILLHPSSLPSPYGIGDLGPTAFAWVDFLAEAGCSYWQLLPLGPTGFGDSPYQSFSSFAGNPLLISPDALIADKLLTHQDLLEAPVFPEDKVDFSVVNAWKSVLLTKAHQGLSANAQLNDAFANFRRQEAAWLDDYALFVAIKEEQAGVAWLDWPIPLRDREAAAITSAKARLAKQIEIIAFAQFLFFSQWVALRSHMAERGIQVIGDLPIYVAQDSVDVWTRPELFQLNTDGSPIAVAGVPPDYFSETGQLWGNPLYRWDLHAKDDFAWWRARISASLNMLDILRLDHFRGFVDYWAVPAGDSTAINGTWQQGPGESFFHALKTKFGELPIIAEDLGEISPAVFNLRDQFSLPGMKILQFAFDDGLEHDFLPHNYPQNCVAYTGTHDNDTTLGWYKSAPESERAFCDDYLKRGQGDDIAWNFIHAIWSSAANLAIAPMQDILSLDSSARMNLPSSSQGNWTWRMKTEALSPQLVNRLVQLNSSSKR
jgi:4-alpha-glucanotransferase